MFSLSDKQAALFSVTTTDPDADADTAFPLAEGPVSHLSLIEAVGGAGLGFSAH